MYESNEIIVKIILYVIMNDENDIMLIHIDLFVEEDNRVDDDNAHWCSSNKVSALRSSAEKNI